MRHLVSVHQLDETRLYNLFRMAEGIRKSPGIRYAPGEMIVANLFFEPSTRTAASFHCAALRLGAHVFTVDSVEFSSMAKGESLRDTIRTISRYADCIVLRHPDDNAALEASAVSKVPVINAGCGTLEHPTQSMLDVYTIFRRTGLPPGLRVGFMGDLRNGRTVHSLVHLLRNWGPQVHFISPDWLRIPDEYKRVDDVEHETPDDIIEHLDVLYVTRVQWERMIAQGLAVPNDRNPYRVTRDNMERAKSDLVLMHPLPRLGELPEWIDHDPRCAIWEQVESGLLVRMAILYDALSDIRRERSDRRARR